jgi:hypothetical protein
MHSGTLGRFETGRQPKALVVRGGLAKTFGSLASFLAFSFLGMGIYILADAFENPVAAQAAALIGAAFVIALASIILYYLLKPRKNPHALKRRHRVQERSRLVMPPLDRPRSVSETQVIQMDLPYQRNYVDHTRIRT